MAIKALNWLSENLGIDITGESDAKDESEGVLGKIGKSFFGNEVQQEESAAIPKENWGYEYNSSTGQWEPTSNAPQHILQEQQQRLEELTAPPKEVAPPPMLGPNANFNWTRDPKGPKYADHFNSYSNGVPPPQTSPVLPTSPQYPSNCIQASPTQEETRSAFVEEQSPMLQFAAPLPHVEQAMVHFAAPSPPPPPITPTSQPSPNSNTPLTTPPAFQ